MRRAGQSVTLPDADRTVEAIDGEELQARSFTAEKLTRILLRELGVPPAPDMVAVIQQLYPFGTGRVKAV